MNSPQTPRVNDAFENLYAGHVSNRLLAGQIHFNESLDTVIFGSASSVHRLDLSNGHISMWYPLGVAD